MIHKHHLELSSELEVGRSALGLRLQRETQVFGLTGRVLAGMMKMRTI